MPSTSMGLLVVEPDFVESFLPATPSLTRVRTSVVQTKLKPLAGSVIQNTERSTASTVARVTRSSTVGRSPGSKRPIPARSVGTVTAASFKPAKLLSSVKRKWYGEPSSADESWSPSQKCRRSIHLRVGNTALGESEPTSCAYIRDCRSHGASMKGLDPPCLRPGPSRAPCPSSDVETKDQPDANLEHVRRPRHEGDRCIYPGSSLTINEGGAAFSGRPRSSKGNSANERSSTTERTTSAPPETPHGTVKRSAPRAVDGMESVRKLAMPDEAHDKVGADALCVVLTSGSFRYLVSRHVKGRTLPTRVALPWRPPSVRSLLRNSPSTLGPNKEQQRGVRCDAWTHDCDSTTAIDDSCSYRAVHDWEQRHAAMNIQRSWRGYLARRTFWTDGGVGLHALATRIQRVYRGRSGKMRAARILAERRARAAIAITSLGYGYQGRGVARRLRVEKHNKAAAAIQAHFRTRVTQRWIERIRLVAQTRRAVRLQSAWRGFNASRRFRVMKLRLLREEKVISDICRVYAEWCAKSRLHKSDSDKHDNATTSLASGLPLPDDFEARFRITVRDNTAINESTRSNGLPFQRGKSHPITFSDAQVFDGALFESSSSSSVPPLPQQQITPSHGNRNQQGQHHSDHSPGGRSTACVSRTSTTVAKTQWSQACRSPSNSHDLEISVMSPRLNDTNGESAPPESLIGTPSMHSEISRAHALVGMASARKLTTAIASAEGGLPGTANEAAAADDVQPIEKSIVGAAMSRVTPRSAVASSGHLDAEAQIKTQQLLTAQAALSSMSVTSIQLNTAQGEGFFVAYGHCLLAGCGTLTRKAANFMGARETKRRGKGGGGVSYADALRVFREGLAHYPNSACLLYGASLAMQAAWHTDGRGGAPTLLLFETALTMCTHGWRQDPERRAYAKTEAYFLAAARGARKNLLLAQAPLARDPGKNKDRASGGRGNAVARGGAMDENAEAEEFDADPEVTDLREGVARAVLHLALWSQIANGNHDMDLRRGETTAAYRRIGRLYTRAMQLDLAFAMPELLASQHTFSVMYLQKAQLLDTCPLRLNLQAPPIQPAATKQLIDTAVAASAQRKGAGGADDTQQGSGHDFPLVPPVQHQQNDQHQSQGLRNKLVECTVTTPNSTSGRGSMSALVTVTAWRNGNKLIFRVAERRPITPVAGTPTAADDGVSSRAIKHVNETGSEAHATGESTPPAEVDKLRSGRRVMASTDIETRGHSTDLLNPGGTMVVVHEDEVDALFSAAIEDQVGEGRPRSLVEAKPMFRLVCEHYIRKVTLTRVCDVDPVHKFSTCCRSSSAFTASLLTGQYVAILPRLESMRRAAAETCARGDAARVLQRSLRGLVSRAECRTMCYELLEVLKEQRGHGRRLLEEDILRRKENTSAARIQGTWMCWKLRRRYASLKSAAKAVQRCFRMLEARCSAEKAERMKLEGPEVLTVLQRGTVVSGVPLMLSVLRCGFSFKFVGRDQEACWAHHGYCYEFEAKEIVQKHNKRYACKTNGPSFISGRVGVVDPTHQNKVVEMLVSRLALVDALPAATIELRAQHRYKTLVVQTTDLDFIVPFNEAHVAGIKQASYDARLGYNKWAAVAQQRGLRGLGILASGAERGRSLMDTRAMVAESYKRYLERDAKWRETRRKQKFLHRHDD